MPGEKGSRYVYSSLHITKILSKIQSTGRPDKLTLTYIQRTWLLPNAQYGAVVEILGDMEFIDSSGTPTQQYAKYQNPSFSKEVLAEGIKKAYPELFKAYPNAQTLSKDDLEGYFREHTGKAESVLDKIVATFKTLCSLADFSTIAINEVGVIKEPQREGTIEQHKVKVEPNIQVNVEIHIAPDTPDDKIEAIFKNMRRYLLGNE